ncbi:MAG: ABC transporter permease [Alphaproteobacteria bacterium]|nr:ABC transporter permease [Alphaproteobacteria bacterium]
MQADLARAWRFARREMRGGIAGFRIFLLCIAIGVAAIAAVHSVSMAVQTGITRDARALHGGDLAVRTTYLPAEAAAQADFASLGRVSEIVEMRAMARGGDGAALVELKAVDNAYPLAGALRLSGGMALEEALADGGAVVEMVLLERLGLAVGDPVKVGDATFTIRAALEREPDRAVGLFSFGPRFMLDMEGLQQTGLVQPGSLIRYRYRIALDDPGRAGPERHRLESVYADRGWRVTGIDSAAPGLRQTVRRLTLFMTLVGLAALIIGGIGVANAVRAHLASHRPAIATLGCLGATPRLIGLTFGLQIATMTALAILAGLGFGATAPFLFASLLEAYLPIEIALGVYPAPLALAAAFGALTAAVFSLPPLAAAARCPPVALFRDVEAGEKAGRTAIAASAILAVLLAALAVATAPDRILALWFVTGALVAYGIFFAAATATVHLARRLKSAGPGAFRRALAALARPGGETSGLILSLGFGVTVLVAVASVEEGLSRQLREEVAADAPTHFFIDIQQDQAAQFDEVVAATPGAVLDRRTPHLRARIAAIDGVPATEAHVPENARWALRGERGLTWSSEPPEGTEIVAGQWWPADYRGPPLVSFDANLAHAFGLEPGDRIAFNILGRTVEAEIANLRRMAWRTLRLQFTTIFAPGALDRAPQTYVAAVRAPPEAEADLTAAMAAALPNVSAIRVKEALARVRDLVAQMGMAVRLVAAVGLAAGLAVLAGAIAAGRRRRRRDAVVFKVLGATRVDLLRSYMLEFAMLGGVAALIGCLLGLAAGYVLLEEVMDIAWAAPLSTAAGVALAAVAVTALFGFVGVWRLLGRPAAPALREP